MGSASEHGYAPRWRSMASTVCLDSGTCRIGQPIGKAMWRIEEPRCRNRRSRHRQLPYPGALHFGISLRFNELQRFDFLKTSARVLHSISSTEILAHVYPRYGRNAPRWWMELRGLHKTQNGNPGRLAFILTSVFQAGPRSLFRSANCVSLRKHATIVLSNRQAMEIALRWKSH